MNTNPTNRFRHRLSFPLISIIQLVTLTIAILTCVNGPELFHLVVNFSGNEYDVLAAIITAGLFGMTIGMAIGLGHIRKWRSMLFCGAVGSTAGLLIVAIYVAPAKPVQAFTAIVLPLVTTIAIRFRAA